MRDRFDHSAQWKIRTGIVGRKGMSNLVLDEIRRTYFTEMCIISIYFPE